MTKITTTENDYIEIRLTPLGAEAMNNYDEMLYQNLQQFDPDCLAAIKARATHSSRKLYHGEEWVKLQIWQWLDRISYQAQIRNRGMQLYAYEYKFEGQEGE